MPDSCSRTSEITYKVAWMKDNEKIVEDAIALWTEMGALQQQVNGKQRAKMLCVVAYDGEKLIGVSTIGVYPQPQVMVKAAHFRCLIRPAYRKRNIATELALRCLQTTEEWSKENPALKIMCYTIRVETQLLFPKCRKPTWHNKMTFIGYSEQGLPVYIYWFKHAFIGEEEDGDYTFYPMRAPQGGM
ncbi:MAG: hypothetical protein ACI8RD_005960 [Bacillariaceae sp.]|jgi:hypothetical protein